MGPQGPQGQQGEKGDPGSGRTPCYLRIYGSLNLQSTVYTDQQPILFDSIGIISGGCMSFTPTSTTVYLAGGKAYQAIFEGAVDPVANRAGSSLSIHLNGVNVGGSGVASFVNRATGQVGANSVTSAAIFTTPAGANSTLTVNFNETDPTRLIGPVLNILEIG